MASIFSWAADIQSRYRHQPHREWSSFRSPVHHPLGCCKDSENPLTERKCERRAAASGSGHRSLPMRPLSGRHDSHCRGPVADGLTVHLVRRPCPPEPGSISYPYSCQLPLLLDSSVYVCTLLFKKYNVHESPLTVLGWPGECLEGELLRLFSSFLLLSKESNLGFPGHLPEAVWGSGESVQHQELIRTGRTTSLSSFLGALGYVRTRARQPSSGSSPAQESQGLQTENPGLSVHIMQKLVTTEAMPEHA